MSTTIDPARAQAGADINPLDGHLTQLVLLNGHLWARKDVFIPVSAIDRVEDDTSTSR